MAIEIDSNTTMYDEREEAIFDNKQTIDAARASEQAPQIVSIAIELQNFSNSHVFNAEFEDVVNMELLNVYF